MAPEARPRATTANAKKQMATNTAALVHAMVLSRYVTFAVPLKGAFRVLLTCALKGAFRVLLTRILPNSAISLTRSERERKLTVAVAIKSAYAPPLSFSQYHPGGVMCLLSLDY